VAIRLSRRPIICLSSQYWSGSWFRKHHFMSRFADMGHQVLYVEVSHSIARRIGYDGRTSNPIARSRCVMVAPRLRVLSPRRRPPKPHVPWVSALWHKRTVSDAIKWAARLGMEDPLWWVYDPEYAPALTGVPPNRLVFDLVDDLAEYSADQRRRAYVGVCVRNLAQQAGALFCTSEPLRVPLGPGGQSVHVVPNGYDSELFRPRPASETKGAGGTRRPTVGFVGTLFDFIDYALIAHTARRIPEADFVLLGHLESNPARVAELFALANVEHVDLVPRDRVPDRIAGFDVCVAPFRRDAVSRSVSPLKVYEYLAMHKPVVCTPMEGLEHEPIARFMDFAVEPGEFSSLVAERLVSWPIDREALDEELRQCTWDRRFASVLAHLPSEAVEA
jgi:glycosyltransferase involved in cell wall biosynthesis